MYFQLAASALPTKGSAHGLLPTAQTQGMKVCKNGKTVFIDLKTLPTPGSAKITGGDREDFTPSIPGAAMKGLLPTPLATNIYHKDRVKSLKSVGGKTPNSRKNGESRPNSLLDVMDFYGMLPTPAAQNYKGASSIEALKARGRLKAKADNLADQFAVSGKTSQLNPLFVAEMMGFPVNWTVSPFLPGVVKALKPTEIR